MSHFTRLQAVQFNQVLKQGNLIQLIAIRPLTEMLGVEDTQLRILHTATDSMKKVAGFTQWIGVQKESEYGLSLETKSRTIF